MLCITCKVNRRNDKKENREHILPVNLFQSCTDDFNGEEFEEFVAHIEWRIKYKIPANINPFSLKELRLKLIYQTIVESRSWLLFLRGARTGSPRRRLARMPPAKMTSMEDTQRDSGCFREKGSEPGTK